MIETRRLVLRDWREDDIDPFIRSTNTPAVMRWLGGVMAPEVAREKIEDRLIRWQRERGFTFWVVERKADGERLGFCGIKLADAPNSSCPGAFEVGWRLRESAWGQGYAKEAAAASLDHAFDRLGAEEVVAITLEGNAPSWGLMLKLGMRRREDLDYRDPLFKELGPAIVYSIDRDGWAANREAKR
jgi:RimJ/RimL family protein N-acetyltransferase